MKSLLILFNRLQDVPVRFKNFFLGQLHYVLILSSVPSINQDTGIKDAWDGKGPTDYLKIRRRFKDQPGDGQFCCDVAPLTSGKIRVGDKVEVLERIPAAYHQGPIPAST